MTGLRKAALWVLGVAAAAWAVIAVAVVVTPADARANIGAGLLFMLAVPCTVIGVVLLVAGRPGRAAPPPAAPPRHPHPGGTLLAAPVTAPVTPPVAGNAPAGWGLALGIAGILVSWLPLNATETTWVSGVLASLALSLAGAALGREGLRRVRVGRAGNRGLAQAAVIVGVVGTVLLLLWMVVLVALFVIASA